ncbi:MAG: beta-phosphoglucomutase [Patescibacteria group bacterium]|nr:beta-phosphoglucomutase [Patescibacteria group bacterium]
MQRKIKAILFDLDGVLVKMPEAHYDALNRALELFGARIEEDEHHQYFNGLPTRKKVMELESKGRLPNGLVEFINEIKQKYTHELIPKYCPPEYSKIILMRQLKNKGIILACCSNSVKETLHSMLRSAHLFDYMDLIIANDEVKNPKPDPEMYLLAMKKLNIMPEETIIVEDSPHGIEAAKATNAEVRIVRGVEDVHIGLFNDILEL